MMETRNPPSDRTAGETRTQTSTRPPHALDELGSAMSAELGELRERLDEVTDRAAHFIRTRPGTSLLIAAAAGYVVGRMLRA
jgi:ElaB/YqjD/DUF883 family membrane-anchored ribosome-binding protein